MNETILIPIFFVVTVVIVLLAFLRVLSIMMPGSNLVLPTLIPFTKIDPGSAILFYPALAFQVWFWAERLGVFI